MMAVQPPMKAIEITKVGYPAARAKIIRKHALVNAEMNKYFLQQDNLPCMCYVVFRDRQWMKHTKM